MLRFLSITVDVLGVFCTLVGLYHVFICLGFLTKKPRSIPEAPDRTRFAVVIPARNEAGVVGELVASLKAQDYPAELADIFVVPNHCTDDTEQKALDAGARVMHCVEPVHTKGEVLRQVFAKLCEDGRYDAFCVLDADNIADPGFLHAMNNAYAAGYECAQGMREAKNPAENWVSGSMHLFYRFMSRVFNESRWRRGLSAHLNGTGFMVASKLIERMGWETQTLTEDLEFTGLCALEGVTIGWVPDALVYDEQPTDFVHSCIQRRRWTAGSLQCMRRLAPKLLFRGNRLAFDAGMLFTANLMNYIGVFTVIVFFADGSFADLVGTMSATQQLLLGAAYLAAMWLLFAVGGLLLNRPWKAYTGKAKLSAVLLFPVFMLTWTPINLYASFTPAPRWKVIPHGVKKTEGQGAG